MKEQKEERGINPVPSQTPPAGAGTSGNKEEGEGTIRKVRSDEAARFDDDYEAEQEDEMSSEEADTEDEGRTGKS